MEFFRDFQLLWLVVCIAGLACSAFFYYRGISKLMGGSEPAQSKRKLRHQSGGGRLVQPDDLPKAPEAEGAESEGHQESLLTGLRSDSDDDDGTPTDGYAIDQGRTTRMNPKANLGERKTLVMEAAGDGEDMGNALRDAVEGSLKEAFGLDDDATSVEEPEGIKPPTEHPDSDIDEVRKKRAPTHTEIIRKAQRHEEMGLHIGIKGGEEVQAQQRLATKELDDILERLDNALGDSNVMDETAESPSAPDRPDPTSLASVSTSANPAVTDPTSEVTTEDFISGGQDTHDEMPTERTDRDHTVDTEAIPPEDRLDLSSQVAETEQQAVSDEEADSESGDGDVDDEVVLDERETTAGTQKGYTTTRVNEQLDSASLTVHGAANEPDSEQDRTRDTSEAGSDDDRGATAEESTAAANSGDIPSWARADTFDEDQDDDKPQQQSLFD